MGMLHVILKSAEVIKHCVPDVKNPLKVFE